MSYKSPHSVREFLTSVCLLVNHTYCLRCQRRTDKDKREILQSTKEIDLVARMAGLFGSSCNLGDRNKERDLINRGPVFEVEVKYLLPGRTNWDEVKKDWDWLLAVSNENRNFEKRGVILAWPSKSFYSFTNCLSVTKDQGNAYSMNGFAPFVPYAEPEMPAHGVNQRLNFKSIESQGPYGLQLPGGKRVRVDLVGEMSHPIWFAIYTRMVPEDFLALPDAQKIQVTNVPIQL